jgi:glutamate-ammonia-ligase adenylyltransferase
VSIDQLRFRHPERARGDLERVQTRAAEGMVTALLPLLADSPNPDQALNLLERLLSNADGDLLALLGRDHVLLHYGIAIFGHSYWLGETLIQNPDLFYSLQRDKDLERSLEREDFAERLDRFRSHSTETDISLLLARFKKREYIRITLRDILNIATLAETTSEISALADVLIEAALQSAQTQIRRRYGDAHQAEARFAVLSLGKLGGDELNYSSDVDLLYLYSGPEILHPEIQLREYCMRQAHLLTEILSCATPAGAVFRIDLRLRPQGQEGEPAIALKRALDYYAHGAQDWELQALIKARHSAGDLALARDFIRGVQARIYTPNVNFAAVETAIKSLDKISSHRRRQTTPRKQKAALDVKLDRGGIRDIEFLVQCLQRVYGGEEPWLRSGGTLFSLQKLNDKGHLNDGDFHELSQAYEFLRVVEHRLQLQRGQQIHCLPESPEQLAVLARSVLGDPLAPPEAFIERLRGHMARVIAIYDRIIHSQKQRRQIESTAFRKIRGQGETAFERTLDRIADDAPVIRETIRNSNMSAHASRNLHRFLSAAMTSPERYASLLENSGTIQNAIPLLETSDYLADILVRHPGAITVLKDLLQGQEHERSIGSLFDCADSPARLRRVYRERRFALAAQDVAASGPAFLSLRQNSRLAADAIRCALRLVQGEQSLSVFALGRLGTEEFDIASDADLLFVRPPEANEEEARLAAERLVNVLAAYTKEGAMFAVDARLRPRGGEGELVVSAAQVERYLREEAQPWEALTYTKLRFIAGREDIAPRVLTSAWHQIIELASHSGFSAAVWEMRARLEKSNRYPGSFKLAAGGFYDVDFITSFLMLREARLVSGNTLERLEALRQAGLLEAADFEELHAAALLYRTVDHAIRLVTGRARPELPAAVHARKAVEGMVSRMLDRPVDGSLQSELSAMQQRVRRVFIRIIHA